MRRVRVSSTTAFRSRVAHTTCRWIRGRGKQAQLGLHIFASRAWFSMVARGATYASPQSNNLTWGRMSVRNALQFLWFVLGSFFLNVAFCESVAVKMPPVYKYWLHGGAPLMDSPEAVVATLQNEQNRQSAPAVISRLFNVRPDPTYPYTLNGRPIVWIWDYEVIWRDAPYNNQSGTTGGVELSQRCPGDDGGDDTWARSSIVDPANPKNILFWCEKQFPVRPVTPLADSCNRCPCPVVPARDGFLANGGALGKPIVPITGDEIHIEQDYEDSSPQGLPFKRIYNSGLSKVLPLQSYGLGPAWRHNFSSRLLKIDNNIVFLDLTDGQRRMFVRDTFPAVGAWRAVGGQYNLYETQDGWIHEDVENDSVFYYNSRGLLAKHRNIHGREKVFDYNADERLIAVTNAFGRRISFSYDASGALNSVKTPDGGVLQYQGGAQTSAVIYADGTSRSYHYEHPGKPNLLTGISVQGVRYASVAYDSNGDAVSTSLAGNVNRYTVNYGGTAPGSAAVVTDPLGNSRTYVYGSVQGFPAVTQSSAPFYSGLPEANSRVQNAWGLIESESDFQGARTVYHWDTNRRLPLAVTEAVDTPYSRSTQTTWHP